MTDDLLEQATRALRDTSAEPNSRSGLTRARMLDSAEKRYASRRSYGLRWIIAIATVFAASTALARVAQYWPEIKRALAPSVEHTAPEATATRKPARPKNAATPVAPPPLPAAAAAEPMVEPAVEAAAAPAPVAEAPAPAARRAPARVKHTPRPQPVPAVVPEPAALETPAPVAVAAAAPPVESAELAVFRRAQRLHRARDPRALIAWDDYLRVADRGALVPEARYNRALVLVRLGRKADAKLALAPFARGEFGNYRRAEAAALLEALDR